MGRYSISYASLEKNARKWNLAGGCFAFAITKNLSVQVLHNTGITMLIQSITSLYNSWGQTNCETLYMQILKAHKHLGGYNKL